MGVILVFNAGSSSLKWELFDDRAQQSLGGFAVPLDPGGYTSVLGRTVREIVDGLDRNAVAVVGHRVVHGGSRFTQPVQIDAVVRNSIADLVSIAPQHNEPALAVIDAIAEALPAVLQVAVFDTAFHATLSEAAFLYAVPYEWYLEHGVRRYGFHGISHSGCASRAAELLNQPVSDLRLVTCHLGSGCSLAAISGGRSVATTMGFSPLDGLVMATRPGALDPGILSWMLATGRIGLDELHATLQHRSGLAGLSGFSGDMREIVAKRAGGDSRAAMAFDVYVLRLVQGIAAMTAALGGLDALVFTGGVGEHSHAVRAEACARMRWLGVEIDAEANESAVPDCDVSMPGISIPVLVIHTREELAIARECLRLITES